MGILLLGVGASAQAEERITFRFAPPDGLHLVLRQTDRETRFLAGRGTQQSETRAKTDFEYSRTGDGFELRTTAISLETRRDEQVVTDPVASALMGQTHVYRIDEDGRLLGVDGLEAVLERVSESFPPDAVRALTPMLDPALLEAAAKAEWKRRYENYAGATVSLGDTWDASAELTLPSGERIEHAVRTTFAASSGCGKARCVEIRTVTRDGAAEAKPGAAKVHYEERRVLEPDTMRVWRETVDQSIEMMLQVPGQPNAKARLTVSREYVYESP